MGLKRAENQVKILLQETIIALCRNTLNSYGEVCVEGLLGVTLDNEEIFLVSINEMFNNPEVAKKLKKNLKRSKEAGDGSDSETEHSDGDDHGDAPKKRKKKRPRKKKKKGDSATTGSGGSGEESGSSTDQDDNDDNTETEANTTQDDHTNNHTDQMNPPHLNIAPEPSNRSSTADHDHRNTKSEEEDSNDLQKIKIKEELEDEDDDEDLVFVKEEIGDSSFNQNQYSNYSSDGQMYMPPGGMHSGQGGLMQMPGQSNVSGNQYSQDFMGDMSNMSNISQGSDSQMMGFSQGQQNMSFTGASPVAGPSSASGLMMWPFGAVTAAASDSSVDPRSICPICGVRLAHANNLKRHIRIHTGHRPYGCSRCGKRFTQSNALKKHELTHIKQDNLDPLNASRGPIQAQSTTCPTTSNVTTPPGMKLNISVTNAVANAIRNPNAVPDESVAMRAPYMLGNLPDRALPFNMMWSALPFAFNPPEKSEKRSDIEDNDDDNDNDDSGDDDNNINDDDKNINDADDNVGDKDDDDKNASSDLDEIDKYIFSNKADDKDNL